MLKIPDAEVKRSEREAKLAAKAAERVEREAAKILAREQERQNRNFYR